jgi:hypothetical protein
MIARPAPHYRNGGRSAGVWLLAVVALLLAPHLAPAGAPAPTSPAPPPGQRAAASSGRALAGNPRIITTRSHGCDPARDLRSPLLDPRVRELLAGAARAYPIRVSCVRTGHSTYVKGTRRVSNHTAWRAVDLDQGDGPPVSRGPSAVGVPGSATPATRATSTSATGGRR